MTLQLYCSIMVTIKKKKWIPVRRSNLKYYDELDLYYMNRQAENVMLYKSAGLKFTDEYLKENPFHGDLYIKPEDKKKCLRQAQIGFSADLTHNVMNADTNKVKEGLVELVGEALSDPRAGGLEVMQEPMEVIVDGYAKQPEIIKNLARISLTDYTTTIHSINVMALTVGYCYYTGKSFEQTVSFGLAALFHDIGKTEIPNEILCAPRKLTDYEFHLVKSHPRLGADILQANSPAVHSAIPGALEHHEKLDGNGYPGNKNSISEIGQVLAVIDSYEAITNDERLYRSAMDPMQALEVLKKDVEAGLLSPKVFVDFAYSLTDTNRGKNSEKYKKIFQGFQLA